MSTNISKQKREDLMIHYIMQKYGNLIGFYSNALFDFFRVIFLQTICSNL